MTYYIEIYSKYPSLNGMIGTCEVAMEFVHGDAVMVGDIEYICWDPWWNRFQRWFVGSGFYKHLKFKK